MAHKALDFAKPGDVVVVDAGGSIFGARRRWARDAERARERG
jgi:hypothetical protein